MGRMDARLKEIKEKVALHHYGKNAEIGDALSWEDIYYLIALAERAGTKEQLAKKTVELPPYWKAALGES
jgi:hypothetical protein